VWWGRGRGRGRVRGGDDSRGFTIESLDSLPQVWPQLL